MVAPPPPEKRPPPRMLHAAAVALAAMLLALGMNVAYTTWVVSSSQHRWCTTLVTLDNADMHAPPPTSKFGRQLVVDFHNLRIHFGCGDLCRTARGSPARSS